MGPRRFLNYVFKVGKRQEAIKFFKEVLDMKVLRHEEFEEACKISSNGPYEGKWSRTVVAYGAEANNFSFEVVYNYGVEQYTCGNDFVSATIYSPTVYSHIQKSGYPYSDESDGVRKVVSPHQYVFYVHNKKPAQPNGDAIVKITLPSIDLRKSLEYYNGTLDMSAYEVHKQSVLFGYSEEQTKLEIVGSGEPIHHGNSFGRMTFGCSRKDQRMIEDDMVATKNLFLCPPSTLETPGKPKVHVLLLADPDRHHICFFEWEAYRQIALTDPEADKLVSDAIIHDQSRAFHARRTSVINTPGARRGSITDPAATLAAGGSAGPTPSPSSRRGSITPGSGSSAGPSPLPGTANGIPPSQRARRSSIIM